MTARAPERSDAAARGGDGDGDGDGDRDRDLPRRPFPIAVIGAGVVSPAGFGDGAAPSTWSGLGAALAAGQRWIAPATALAPTHPGVAGCEVPAIPADRDVGDRRVHRLMARGARLGSVAVHAALDQAGLDAIERNACGFFYGVGASGSAPDEIDTVLRASVDADGRYRERLMGERGLKLFHPLRTFALMPNFTLCHPAILERTRGPSAAVFSRGAGTVTALIEAAHAIVDGDCPVAITGGADTALDCLTWAELVRDGHAGAGLIPGEAGAALVLAVNGDVHRPLAWITGAAVRTIGGDATAAIRAVIDDVGGTDEVTVLAAWGRIADVARPLVPGRVVDLCAAVGDALAATPALAWCAALDLIRGGARSVLTVGAGTDGHVTAVRFVAAPPAQLDSGTVAETEPEPELAVDATIPAARWVASGDVEPSGWAGITVTRRRRAVITGVGTVCGFGVGFRALLDGLAAGRRAISPVTCFDASPLAARVGGQVPADTLDDAWLAEHLPAPHLEVARRWLAAGALRDRKVGFALVAAAEAVAAAGIDPALLAAAPLALACGLERGLVEDLAPVLTARGVDWAADARRTGPAIRNRAAIDLAARAVADLLAIRAPITVHASACAAGALAVAHGAALIERGADVVVCGAADTMLDPIGMGAMIALGTTSPRATDLDACRPFDRRRDGLVLGEGAAVFVLEAEHHAIARGARPLAAVLGWGASQDGYKPSAPDPDGARASVAMSRALGRAGVAPHDLGYVNAHGTGTPLNDVAEVRALHRALFEHAAEVPVSSIKGAVGHLMTAAGAIELAAALLAFERDLLPGTANHRDRDPDCDVDVIGEAPRVAHVDTLMSSSFGFGGQNAAVVLGRSR